MGARRRFRRNTAGMGALWSRLLPRRLRHPGSLLLLLLLAWLLGRNVWQEPSAPAPTWMSEGTYTVQRVVDGDTLQLSNGARVRLIGVDTPETVHPERAPQPLGKEASQFTRRRVEGKEVRLRFDRERTDRYGRFLAYVHVDDVMLNEELIRAGYSKAETGFRYDPGMKRRFRQAEHEAQLQRRGIWSKPGAGKEPRSAGL